MSPNDRLEGPTVVCAAMLPLPDSDTDEIFVVADVLIEAVPEAEPDVVGVNLTRTREELLFETEKLPPEAMEKGADVVTVPEAASVPLTC